MGTEGGQKGGVRGLLQSKKRAGLGDVFLQVFSDTPLLLIPDLGPAAHVLLHHRPLLLSRTPLLWGMASFSPASLYSFLKEKGSFDC